MEIIREELQGLQNKLTKINSSDKLDLSGGELTGELEIQDNLTLNSTAKTEDLIPQKDDTYDLGSEDKGFNNAYIHQLFGSSILTIGDGDTSHSLTNTDDLLVSGNLEVNGNSYFDGDVTFGGTFSVGGSVMSNLGTPISDTDAATKAYVDSQMSGAGYQNGGGVDLNLANANLLNVASINGLLSSTELGFLNGVTSEIQTQFSNLDLNIDALDTSKEDSLVKGDVIAGTGIALSGNTTDAIIGSDLTISTAQDIRTTASPTFTGLTLGASGLNMSNYPITNIGNANTDFTGTGGLTLADALTVSAGGIDVTGLATFNNTVDMLGLLNVTGNSTFLSGISISGETSAVIANEDDSNQGTFSAVVGTPNATAENNSHHSGFVAISENTSGGNSLASLVSIAERNGKTYTAPVCNQSCEDNDTITLTNTFAATPYHFIYFTAPAYGLSAYTTYYVCNATANTFQIDDSQNCSSPLALTQGTPSSTIVLQSNSSFNHAGLFQYSAKMGQLNKTVSVIKALATAEEAGTTVSKMIGVTTGITQTANATLTDAIGFNAIGCGNSGGGTITNCTGVNIESQAAGTNNRGIVLNNGADGIYFNGTAGDGVSGTKITSTSTAMTITGDVTVTGRITTLSPPVIMSNVADDIADIKAVDLIVGSTDPTPSVGTEYDFSGSGNHFEYSGFADNADSQYADGGRQLTFDNTDDQLTRVDDSDFELESNNWIIQGWIKPTLNTVGTIIAKAGEWVVYMDSTSRLYFYAIDSSDGDDCARRTGSATALAGTWYHFAIVHSGDGGTDYCNAELVFYLNGVAVSTVSGGEIISGGFTITGTAGTIAIGNTPGGQTYDYYAGDVGVLTVDNGNAWSANDVLTYYNSTRALYGK